ncbi:MAG TPA: transporter substrate-binding domain-containing protein [Cellvibrionaceae bacterium]
MAVVTRGIVLAVLIALSAALWIKLYRDSSFTTLQQQQLIRIGYAVELPYAYVDDSGYVTGWAPELARQISHSLGIDNIEWIQVRFAELLPGLMENRFDVVAAGLFITPERQQQVAFSDPVHQVSSGLLVRADTPIPPLSYTSLVRNYDYTVAVLHNSVEHRRLLELGLPRHRLLMVPDAYTGNIALKNKRADVLALSLPSLKVFFDLKPENLRLLPLITAQSHHTQDQVAFAFNRKAEHLRQQWNRVQAEVLAATDDHIPSGSREGTP